MIFQCFGEPERCPGGDPGTCAAGRDVDSIACSTCLDGLHADGGDYFLIIVVTLLVCAGIVVLYVVSLRKGQKSAQPGSLLIAALGLGQMITVVQQLTVIQQFKIQWGEPFSSMLVSFDIFAFDLDLISLGCVAPMAPVAKFTMRTLLVLVFFAVACLVHFFFIAMFQKGKGLQLSVLGGTVGTLFMIFFISVCSSLLAPFRCYAHPNGRSTVQAYHSVLCDMNNEHLQMSLVGGLCCLLPIAFLTVCSYITLVKLPSWIADGEVKLIRSCSFLFMRFRPGAEVYSVLFSVRNALVVLCPLLPSASGRILCMNLVLYGSLVMVAYGKPWRATLCNTLDLFLLAGMLVILDMGSLFVLNIDGPSTAAICIVFSTVMFISIVAAVFYGIAKHVMLKYHKPFRYFVCHQKNAAGSYARLLKIELQKRGPRFSTFIDCDDLNDLTKLFSYVGQDTQTLLILGSPQILTRKWCVGEMVTGRIENVHTVLLTFPGFVMPDESFIETYTTLVPPTVQSVLLICSDGCFSSLNIARWLLEVLQVATCSLLPIIAEDGFRFPSDSFYDQLVANPELQDLDLDTYEIAVVFSPQNYSSTAEDLELRASQVAWRLQNGLQPLATKVQQGELQVKKPRAEDQEVDMTLNTFIVPIVLLLQAFAEEVQLEQLVQKEVLQKQDVLKKEITALLEAERQSRQKEINEIDGKIGAKVKEMRDEAEQMQVKTQDALAKQIQDCAAAQLESHKKEFAEHKEATIKGLESNNQAARAVASKMEEERQATLKAMAEAEERQKSAVQSCRSEASEGLLTAAEALAKHHQDFQTKLQDDTKSKE
eukprot:g24049.t1